MNKTHIFSWIAYEDFDIGRTLNTLHKFKWKYTAGSPSVSINDSVIKITCDNTLNSGIYLYVKNIKLCDLIFECMSAKNNADRFLIDVSVSSSSLPKWISCGIYTLYAADGLRIRRIHAFYGTWYKWADGPTTLNDFYIIRAVYFYTNKQYVECFRWNDRKRLCANYMYLPPLNDCVGFFSHTLRNSDVAVAGICGWTDYVGIRSARQPSPSFRTHKQVYEHIYNGRGKEVGVINTNGVL